MRTSRAWTALLAVSLLLEPVAAGAQNQEARAAGGAFREMRAMLVTAVRE
jgi:hypothetical protein